MGKVRTGAVDLTLGLLCTGTDGMTQNPTAWAAQL